MSDYAFALHNIKRHFMQGGEKLEVLRGVDLAIHAGEIVALVGPSGSGKTTLLQVAGLLDQPDEGDVIIGGDAVEVKDEKQRTRRRLQDLGFVYQFHHLLPEFSAEENVMLPQMIAGIAREDAKKRAHQLLDSLGLAKRYSHRPARLSGGEQQRVAIARALANSPKILLADEPTGNLDPHTAESVFSLFLQVAKENHVAALIATHNMEIAKGMHRRVQMMEGKVTELS